MTGSKKPLPPGSLAELAPPNEDRTYFENGGDHPFLQDAGGFELVNAWWMAEASLLAYADEDFVGARLREAGLPEVAHFHGESTQCYAAHDDDFVIVAFSGSDMRERKGNNVFDALADWMVNLSFDTVPSERGGRVHRGFSEALDEVWGDEAGGLEGHLDGLCGEGSKEVWFTGHSLGGALATLAAGRYERAPEVYTFGAPRVGDEEYVESLDVPVYRFVNGRDAVSKLPLRGPYRHAGVEKYIDDEGRIHDGKPGGEGLRAKGGRAVGRLLTTKPSGGALRDHAPILYAIHIWNAYVEG
ncbi:lipase family protein [Rubrobacter tropicus]|uniref:lipase family protein n=1 Tax=Rubrobacter tropicus TaxID=2653851 RepID=UPI0014083276|nr:lipase family protein [Rubrobacter tropicus]